MSQYQKGIDITLEASGDLSSYQYYFVKLDANGKVALCGANQRAIGILQNKPDAEGEAARVRIVGTSKLIVNEACDEGEHLTSTSGGKGEVVDAADEFYRAMAIEAATAQNDIIEVMLCDGYAAASEAG